MSSNYSNLEHAGGGSSASRRERTPAECDLSTEVWPWPLVGRSRQLERFCDTLAVGTCSGVVLAGVAGAGKTRLAVECLALAATPAAFDDGAAYDPANNTWRLLPPAPIAARANTLALWTGGRLILLGGRPAVQGGADQGFADGAVFDPAQRTWQHIDAPRTPSGHGLSWETAAATDKEIFAWSGWSTSQQLGPNTSGETGGTDLFAYEPSTRQWRQIQPSPGALARTAEALWTGQVLVVRGDTYNCGGCSHPYTPTATALYDPAQNTWTPVPPDPLGASHLLSVWTGAAMLSFNPGGLYGKTIPGDSSAYEPSTGQWTLLAQAPFGCSQSPPPLWTGTQVLLYCPQGDATHHGIALTVQS